MSPLIAHLLWGALPTILILIITNNSSTGNVVIVEGGGGDNWKTQSNTPGVRKKYRLGQGTETEKVFKN